jgi:hypothetical protein
MTRTHSPCLMHRQEVSVRVLAGARPSTALVRRAPERAGNPRGGKIASMCWTVLTLGLFTGSAVLWRGGSTHNEGLKLAGAALLVTAVIAGAYFG